MSTETRSGQPRYWCHLCNSEVPIYMAPDPTCQRCHEQFIEELQSDDDPREFLGTGDNNNTGSTGGNRLGGMNIPEVSSTQFFTYSPSTGRLRNMNENDGEMNDDIFQLFSSVRNATNNNNNEQTSQEQQQTANQDNDNNTNNDNNNTTPLGNFVQNILSNVLGQNFDINSANQGTDENGQTRPMLFFGNMVDGNIRIEALPRPQNNNNTDNDENMEVDDNNNNSENTNNARGPTGGGNNLAGILQFLSAMTGAPIDGGMVGNPNDYVFSQNALDNIITQLMEQTGSGSAPPPAPETVIDALEHRKLTDEEKSQETDCAVCKDQFEPSEQVIELPCKHIFHDDCIKPWLKLNSTCPVCRHTVLPESAENNTDNNDTQGETNRSTTDSSSGNENNNNSSNTTTFSWFGSSNNQQEQQQRTPGQPITIPLNLSAAFPWVNNLANRSAENQSSSPQQQPNSSSDNGNDPNDDLDLD